MPEIHIPCRLGLMQQGMTLLTFFGVSPFSDDA